MASERALYAQGMVDVSRSGWTLEAPGDGFASLEGERSADVAVVGAGLAGSSLALHLAEGGASVAIVEARVAGWGASGRNAGHVVSHREYAPAALARLPEGGERFLALLRGAGDLVYGLAQRHAIDCDAAQAGYFMVAARDNQRAALERKVDKWRARGFRLRFADRDATARALGTDRFAGAALDEAGGRINPYRFTRGLARAAERAGAAVFERSPAERIEREGARWCVRTPRGAVRAERVVVCTNGYTTDVVPALARAWLPLSAYGVALGPLPDVLRKAILPGGGVMMQMPTGFHPTLVDGAGRLVTASLPAALRPQRSGPPLREALRWLHQTFPQARGVPLGVDSYWTGAMAWSPDLLPRVFEAAPGLLSLGSFSGEGNALAPALGRHLAEALLRDGLRDLALPVTAPPVLRARWRLTVSLRWLGVPLMRALDRLGLY